jgi:hypothetical protein
VCVLRKIKDRRANPALLQRSEAADSKVTPQASRGFIHQYYISRPPQFDQNLFDFLGKSPEDKIMKLVIGVIVSAILATALSAASAMPVTPTPQVSDVEQTG